MCAVQNAPSPCYTALQLQKAYDLNPLFAQGLDGKGITVVVLAETMSPALGSELGVFDAAFHLPPARIRVVSMAGSEPRLGGSTELTLDTEAVHTMAPGADIVVLVVPTSPNPSSIEPQAAAVRFAAERRLGQVITTSLGNIGEAALGGATVANLHQDFEYAATDT